MLWGYYVCPLEILPTLLVTIEENGCIALHPEVAIPACEAWLFKNKEAIKSVKTGLEQSSKGEIKKRGCFAKYIEKQ